MNTTTATTTTADGLDVLLHRLAELNDAIQLMAAEFRDTLRVAAARLDASGKGKAAADRARGAGREAKRGIQVKREWIAEQPAA